MKRIGWGFLIIILLSQLSNFNSRHDGPGDITPVSQSGHLKTIEP